MLAHLISLLENSLKNTLEKLCCLYKTDNVSHIVRLVDGLSNTSGRIEVLINGEWGTVCDNEWNLEDANVSCRQLGYKSALLNFTREYFGRGSGPIWISNVQCNGNETSLLECRQERVLQRGCTHKQDVGVLCRGKAFWMLKNKVLCYPLSQG